LSIALSPRFPHTPRLPPGLTRGPLSACAGWRVAHGSRPWAVAVDGEGWIAGTSPAMTAGGGGASANAARAARCEDQQGQPCAQGQQYIEGHAVKLQGAQDVGDGEGGFAGAEGGQVDQFAIIGARAAESKIEGAGEGGFGPAGIGRFMLFRIA